MRVLFLGKKQVFSSEIQWNNQSLADTREMISHFIHQHLNGVERVNLHVILGQIIVIEDLDANNQPLPRRSEVTIDYLAPLSASPTGNIVDDLLVVPPGAPGSTGLPGGAPTQLALLVQRVQDIDPSYSTAAAIAFLRQFNFPAMTRLNDYQTLLNGIQSYGYSLASIRPGQPDSQKYHSLTRVEFGTIVVPPHEQVLPPAPPVAIPQLPTASAGNYQESGYWPKNISGWPFTEDERQSLETLKRLHPEKDKKSIEMLWGSYNMSGELRQRFISELMSTGQVPVWAEYHRVASMNPNNLNRFDNITAVTTPILTSLQNRVRGSSSHQHSAVYHFSPEFLRAYTQILGYQRNREKALFRTDISGVFRGDHRTPDELSSHRKMIAFTSGHSEQHTTDITLCTSTAYGDANIYGRKNTGLAEQFHYGYQDDDEYYSFDSADESDDDESGALRRKQKDGFVYLIDTRGIEVVPIADNQVLNPDNSTVGGMTVSAEIHVSVPRTGLPSNRIWLVNSDGTKAVKIDDLHEHFHEELSSLEKQTFAGANSDIYDYLFIEAENKGLPILDLSEMTSLNAQKNIRHYEHRHYPRPDQPLRTSPSHIPPAGHIVYPYEIAVVNPNDENAMMAAGQWLREDQTRRYLVDINGAIYSPNGNPLELASSELVRQAFRQQMASLPTDQYAQVLFIRDQSRFSSNIQWNGQTLPDTQQKIGRFIHQHLAGVNPVNLRVALGYMTVIHDLDANNEPLPSRSEVTIDYMAPLSLSPEGHTVVAPLVIQPSTSRPTGLFGGNAAFNESLRPVDSADLPRARNHLTSRLRQVLELMDALHANRRQLNTLDTEESRDLTDFFHRRDGSLNQEAIAKALSQPRVYQLWRNNVVQLLQLRGVHTQLAGLSGQRALTRSQNWSEQQVSAITDWKTFEAQWPDVRVYLAPQALFLGDKSRYARTFSTALGLGLLAADQQGAPAVANYLTGLTTHARLNEEAAEGQQSDYDRRQVRQLRQLFDGLRTLPEAHPTIFSRQSLPATYTELAVGHYLLKVNQQVLALSVKENGHFSLYRPRVGLMQINGAEANENRQALVAALRTQLNTSTEVSLYKVDIALAVNSLH